MASSKPTQKASTSMLIGAALLMATSAIGPGFLTQTATFTEQYKTSFSCIMILAILMALVVQLNVWRILIASGKTGNIVANEVLPGLGYVISALVFIGGIAFEIGNVAGAGMGLNVLFGVDVKVGAALSAVVCIAIFVVKQFGKAMDKFSTILGGVMIVLSAYAAVTSHAPVGQVLYRTVAPETFSFLALTTLLGGTVGGYITFSGAHRLLDGGVKGPGAVHQATRTATMGIIVTAVVRYLLFFAVLGVVLLGIKLDPANPAATPFQHVAGTFGYKLFGLVLWSAAATSIVGCAYTSFSFVKSYFKTVQNHYATWIMAFIVFCTAWFIILGRPVTLLVLAGSINGLILPFSLGAVLLASRNKKIVGEEYHHPTWLIVLGVIVVAIALYSGIRSLGSIASLWKG
ncbi:MAG TPA: divalent metal cation transporter [Candidatus Cryosericum sp.]|nr:divalent metal cation transporter [Candidatus Cryosericum sp.]